MALSIHHVFVRNLAFEWVLAIFTLLLLHWHDTSTYLKLLMIWWWNQWRPHLVTFSIIEFHLHFETFTWRYQRRSHKSVWMMTKPNLLWIHIMNWFKCSSHDRLITMETHFFHYLALSLLGFSWRLVIFKTCHFTYRISFSKTVVFLTYGSFTDFLDSKIHWTGQLPCLLTSKISINWYLNQKLFLFFRHIRF